MIFIDASAGIDALLVIGLEGERLSLFEGGASGKVIFKIMLEYGVRRVKGALNPLVIGPLRVVAAERGIRERSIGTESILLWEPKLAALTLQIHHQSSKGKATIMFVFWILLFMFVRSSYCFSNAPFSGGGGPGRVWCVLQHRLCSFGTCIGPPLRVWATNNQLLTLSIGVQVHFFISVYFVHPTQHPPSGLGGVLVCRPCKERVLSVLRVVL